MVVKSGQIAGVQHFLARVINAVQSKLASFSPTTGRIFKSRVANQYKATVG